MSGSFSSILFIKYSEKSTPTVASNSLNSCPVSLFIIFVFPTLTSPKTITIIDNLFVVLNFKITFDNVFFHLFLFSNLL